MAVSWKVWVGTGCCLTLASGEREVLRGPDPLSCQNCDSCGDKSGPGDRLVHVGGGDMRDNVSDLPSLKHPQQIWKNCS